MSESIKRIVGPYQDSYSPNGIIGEKDACGVGFIANIKGVESNWILKPVSYTHLTLPTSR